jgi:hypothetical protein
LADRENEPNTESDQRERERELHRAQLDAVRSAFAGQEETPRPEPEDPEGPRRAVYLIARLSADMRRLEHKQKSTARVAAALAVSLVLGAAALVAALLLRLGDPFMFDEISARSVRADRIALSGDLRLLDAHGNELALLGREPDAAGGGEVAGPVVLALNAEGDPSKQLLRFAASKTGAGLTLGAPTGDSSVSLLSTETGSTVEVRHGEETERVAGDRLGTLAPVSAGPRTGGALLDSASAVPLSAPRRAGPPSGELPELRDVGHGFLVADLSAHPAADGVEVRGRMVNTTAVVHSGLAFRITLGDASATVTVPKISPGNSTGFRVAFPGASAETAAAAQVEYLGSTVAFQATSTEPLYGRRVESR